MSNNNSNNTEYNGWKNRATWNVALWLCNDEGLYNAMVDYCRERGNQRKTYMGFVRYAGLVGARTPDNFKFTGKSLDYKALTQVVCDNAPEES